MTTKGISFLFWFLWLGEVKPCEPAGKLLKVLAYLLNAASYLTWDELPAFCLFSPLRFLPKERRFSLA